MNESKTKKLLQKTQTRLRVSSIGRAWYWTAIVFAILYGILLLVSRLTGLIPNFYTHISLLVVPVSALLVALVVHRRVDRIDASKAIDRAARTKDLFLTTVMLERAPGEFKPLVAADAETRAAKIRPQDVVPWPYAAWGKKALQTCVLLALLAAGGMLLGQFDPFGTVAAAEEEKQVAKKLAQSREDTKKLLKKAKTDLEDREKQDEVEQALTKLKSTFNKLQPDNKKLNRQMLSGEQKGLGGQWKKLNAQKLSQFLDKRPTDQQFGGGGSEEMEKWMQELQGGSSESLKKAMSELQEQLERLQKTTDPAEKAELMQQVQQKLQELADFSKEKANSQPLAASLERALEQLEMARSEGLSTDALKAVSESLELCSTELEMLAQSAKDLQKLEEALKTLQMAKQANEQEALDGEAMAGAQTLADYEAMFAEMMAGQMPGNGGMGNEGFGEGGVAPEDDSADTDFKTERSKSHIEKGKVLLSLKTKGLGEKNEVTQEYREAVQAVRQGVSEAIYTEEIPPGYHEGIKKYFDSIDSGSGGAAQDGAVEEE